MKKTIMFLGMLSLGLAQAQQGNVGINTDEPKATLEIKPTATNLAGTTNEGIVAPKLSKIRVAAITDLVEGTLVYVTDEATSAIASYTGSDVKVAKIDEKGYYYFDGTEWVKAKNVAQDQEWVYDETTKRINLKRSGDTSGTFKNSIFYNAETGQYVDIDDENKIRGLRLVNNNRNMSFEETTSTLSNDIKYKNYIHSESKNLHASIIRSSSGTEITHKKLGSQSIVVTEGDNTQNFYTQDNGILVPPTNTNNYNVFANTSSGISLFGTGEINSAIATQGSVSIGNSQSVKGYITGILGNSTINTSGNINEVYGLFGRIMAYSPVGAKIKKLAAGNFLSSMPLNDNSLIQEFIGLSANASNGSSNTGTGTYLAGVHSIVNQYGQTKYPNMYGIYTGSTIANYAIAPDNHYGLYINNLSGADKANYGIYVGNVSEVKTPNGKITDYALYTNKGKVRLGDYTMVKTDVIAPKSSLTVDGHIATGYNNAAMNRSIFIGGALQANEFGAGTFVGFGTYRDDSAGVYKFKTSKDNDSNNKNRFLIFNDTKFGKVYFSSFTTNDGKIEQDFKPDTESTLTIAHEGKKVGVGTNAPQQKLDVAGSIKIASTDDTCDSTKAGTIRFVAGTKKFQGCTGTAWVDLH